MSVNRIPSSAPIKGGFNASIKTLKAAIEDIPSQTLSIIAAPDFGSAYKNASDVVWRIATTPIDALAAAVMSTETARAAMTDDVLPRTVFQTASDECYSAANELNGYGHAFLKTIRQSGPQSQFKGYANFTPVQKEILMGLQLIQFAGASTSPQKALQLATTVLRSLGADHLAFGTTILDVMDRVYTMGGTEKAILALTAMMQNGDEGISQNDRFYIAVLQSVISIVSGFKINIADGITAPPVAQKSALPKVVTRHNDIKMGLPSALTAAVLVATKSPLAAVFTFPTLVLAGSLENIAPSGSCLDESCHPEPTVKALHTVLSEFTKGIPEVAFSSSDLNGFPVGEDTDPEPWDKEGKRDGFYYKQGFVGSQLGESVLKHVNDIIQRKDGEFTYRSSKNEAVRLSDGSIFNRSPEVVDLGQRQPTSWNDETFFARLVSQSIPGVHGGDTYWGDSKLTIVDVESFFDQSLNSVGRFFHKMRGDIFRYCNAPSTDFPKTCARASEVYKDMATTVDEIPGLNDLLSKLDGITPEFITQNEAAIIAAVELDNSHEGRNTNPKGSISKLITLLTENTLNNLVKAQMKTRFLNIADILKTVSQDQSSSNELQKLIRPAYIAGLRESLGESDDTNRVIEALQNPDDAGQLSGNYNRALRNGVVINPFRVLMVIVELAEQNAQGSTDA